LLRTRQEKFAKQAEVRCKQRINRKGDSDAQSKMSNISAPSDLLLDVVRLINVLTYLLIT